LVKILEANNKQNIAHLQAEGFFTTDFIGKVSENFIVNYAGINSLTLSKNRWFCFMQ